MLLFGDRVHDAVAVDPKPTRAFTDARDVDRLATQCDRIGVTVLCWPETRTSSPRPISPISPIR